MENEQLRRNIRIISASVILAALICGGSTYAISSLFTQTFKEPPYSSWEVSTPNQTFITIHKHPDHLNIGAQFLDDPIHFGLYWTVPPQIDTWRNSDLGG